MKYLKCSKYVSESIQLNDFSLYSKIDAIEVFIEKQQKFYDDATKACSFNFIGLQN